MRFHYYGQPQDLAGYGYYGEAPQFPGYAGYDGYGYYGQPAGIAGFGYYGEPEPVGYYADEAPMGYYADDPNAVSDYDTAGYGEAMPEMVGYGDGEQFAEEYPGVSDYSEDYSEYGDGSEYGEPGIEGYVRAVPPPFNAGCPLPLNAGLAAGDDFAGYSKPADVSPSCTAFAEQPGSPSMIPDTLRPLW